MGLYGVAITEEWGGAGLDYTALAVACEEISAGDCATATIVAGEQPGGRNLAGYGSDAQKKQFLRALARGARCIGAFMLTEPHVGSDATARSPRAPSARATHYVLNGVKQFITSGKNADVAVVFAVTDKNGGRKASARSWCRPRRPATSPHREDRQRASNTAARIVSAQNCPNRTHLLG